MCLAFVAARWCHVAEASSRRLETRFITCHRSCLGWLLSCLRRLLSEPGHNWKHTLGDGEYRRCQGATYSLSDRVAQAAWAETLPKPLNNDFPVPLDQMVTDDRSRTRIVRQWVGPRRTNRVLLDSDQRQRSKPGCGHTSVRSAP